jgi:hypothetical protein
MEKKHGEVKFIETDDGFRIEVTGKSLKDALSCCCIPIAGIGKAMKVECCPPEEKKKD